MLSSRRRTAGAVAIITVALVALVGCATDGGDAGTSPVQTAPAATDYLAEAYAGIVGEVTTEPVAITDDISAWVVSCGEAVISCSSPSAAAAEAATEVGWQVDVCDGKLNPNGWSECIRSGIAAKADVMLVIGQDCASFSGALEEAKNAGIVTVGVGGTDCADGPLFSAVTQQMPDMSSQEWWTTLGELQAKWLIGKAGGDAKLLNIEFNDTIWGPWITEGRLAVFEACDTCEVVGTLQLANSDVASGALAQKFETALLQQPSVNSVAIPIDGWFLAGLAQGIEASGRSADLNVVGAFGSIPNFGLIRDGVGEDATVAFSMEWDGWAGVDAALRLLAGQEVQASGIGMQTVDAETNLPAPGEPFSYSPEVDFRSAYRAAWGL